MVIANSVEKSMALSGEHKFSGSQKTMWLIPRTEIFQSLSETKSFWNTFD